MKVGIPRISALVITYKQEDLIGRTLDSLLAQKDYLYEICVSDDCSPDNTWNVLLDYQSKYPDLIKLHRNEHNVGIFENFEQVWTMPTGDVIYQVSGDDECGAGWFKKVLEFIENKGIDYKNELFCIYGDIKNVYPNGDYYIRHNKTIDKYPNQAVRLAIRDLVNNRSACFSINILKKFEKVSQGRSHIVEFVQDRQLQLYAEKNYYLPGIGNIYYSSIGVSSHLDEETLKVRQQIWPFSVEYIQSKGYTIRKSDIYYGESIRAQFHFRFYHDIPSLFRSIWYSLICFDIRFIFRGDRCRHLFFAAMRRLPHKSPIHFN